VIKPSPAFVHGWATLLTRCSHVQTSSLSVLVARLPVVSFRRISFAHFQILLTDFLVPLGCFFLLLLFFGAGRVPQYTASCRIRQDARQRAVAVTYRTAPRDAAPHHNALGENKPLLLGLYVWCTLFTKVYTIQCHVRQSS